MVLIFVYAVVLPDNFSTSFETGEITEGNAIKVIVDKSNITFRINNSLDKPIYFDTSRRPFIDIYRSVNGRWVELDNKPPQYFDIPIIGVIVEYTPHFCMQINKSATFRWDGKENSFFGRRFVESGLYKVELCYYGSINETAIFKTSPFNVERELVDPTSFLAEIDGSAYGCSINSQYGEDMCLTKVFNIIRR